MTKNTIITVILAATLGTAIGAVGHMFFSQGESPYLKHANRLGDVIEAICVMGTDEGWDSRPPESWHTTIGSQPVSADTWADVFRQHPEFFRQSQDGNVSLVWRRAQAQTWDPVKKKRFDEAKLEQLSDRNGVVARGPLTPEQTTQLMETAVNLQSQAIARREELRWWVPVLVGVVCVFIGARFKS